MVSARCTWPWHMPTGRKMPVLAFKNRQKVRHHLQIHEVEKMPAAASRRGSEPLTKGSAVHGRETHGLLYRPAPISSMYSRY